MTRKQLRKILDKMARISITGCDTLRECDSFNELNLVQANFCRLQQESLYNGR